MQWYWLLIVGLLCATPIGRWGFRIAAVPFSAVARRPAWAVTAIFLLSLGLNSGLSLLVGLPDPVIHDEFSYLLAADTFAHGRLTNPTHPFWQHFESFHIFHQPTYMSKYPPGQGLALALGIVTFGHPIAGAWFATAAACAALCWMLYAWVPPKWALLGGLLAASNPLILSWSQNYWGGSVALLGAAVFTGAFRRVFEKPSITQGILLGLGMTIFANSRPYEGAVFSILMGVPLAAWGFSQLRRGNVANVARVASGAAGILLLGAAWLGYYNYRVAGHPLRLAYTIHDSQYCITPHFLFQSLRPAPEYRHKEFVWFHTVNEAKYWHEQRTLRGWAAQALTEAHYTLVLFTQPWQWMLGLSYIMLPLLLWRDPWMRLAVGIILMFIALALWPVTWPAYEFYAAPVGGLLLVALIRCMQAAWHSRIWNVPWGAIVLRAAIGLGLLAPYRVCVGMQNWRRMNQNWFAPKRAQFEGRLEADGRKHLVIVRYGPNHSALWEWVYNRADIDSAPVVWARDMGPEKNRQLLDYFKDREVWLLTVDDTEYQWGPYPGR